MKTLTTFSSSSDTILGNRRLEYTHSQNQTPQKPRKVENVQGKKNRKLSSGSNPLGSF